MEQEKVQSTKKDDDLHLAERPATWRLNLTKELAVKYVDLGDATQQAWSEWCVRLRLCVRQTIIYWEEKSDVAKGRKEAAELIVCPVL